MKRDFNGPRPFMGHQSRCEICARMFVRNGCTFTCPACVSEQAAVKLPVPLPDLRESSNNPHAALFAKRVERYRHRFKADRLIRKDRLK